MAVKRVVRAAHKLPVAKLEPTQTEIISALKKKWREAVDKYARECAAHENTRDELRRARARIQRLELAKRLREKPLTTTTKVHDELALDFTQLEFEKFQEAMRIYIKSAIQSGKTTSSAQSLAKRYVTSGTIGLIPDGKELKSLPKWDTSAYDPYKFDDVYFNPKVGSK